MSRCTFKINKKYKFAYFLAIAEAAALGALYYTKHLNNWTFYIAVVSFISIAIIGILSNELIGKAGDIDSVKLKKQYKSKRRKKCSYTEEEVNYVKLMSLVANNRIDEAEIAIDVIGWRNFEPIEDMVIVQNVLSRALLFFIFVNLLSFIPLIPVEGYLMVRYSVYALAVDICLILFVFGLKVSSDTNYKIKRFAKEELETFLYKA